MALVVRIKDQPHRAAVGDDPRLAPAAVHPHPVALQRPLDDLGGVGVLARKDAVHRLDQVDLASKASKRLGKLASDRAGPDDAQTPWQRRQREYGLVGQVPDFLDSRNRRRGSPCARRDTRPGESDLPAVDLEPIAAREPAVADEDVDAETGEPLGGIVPAQVRSQSPETFHHRGEIDFDAVGHTDAELARVPNRPISPRGCDQRFGGDAPDVEAIAAQQVFLDQRHLRPEPGRPDRGDEPSRSRAHHKQVVPPGGFGIAPSFRPDMTQPALVVLIPGMNGRQIRRCRFRCHLALQHRVFQSTDLQISSGKF